MMAKLPFKRTSERIDANYVRNFIFGVEDSLVSTVGLLSGVAIANVEQRTILLAGVVLIFVEAFSMGTGSFLSESGAAEYSKQGRSSLALPIKDALIMFVSYFVTGFVPLAPYLFLPVATAFWVSIGAALVALFALGAGAGRYSRVNWVRGGVRAFVVGGIAVLLGVIVGRVFSIA